MSNEKTSRYQYLLKQTRQQLFTPLYGFAIFTAIAGLFALVLEVRYFPSDAPALYMARLTAVGIAFIVLILAGRPFGKKNPVLLLHVLLLSIIVSFGVVILLVPGSFVFNSHIISLIIFTAALFLSWEVHNQIIVAIYYNVVFSVSIIFSDSSIYILPNMFETVLFVLFISIMSIAASSFNYKLRREAIFKSLEVSVSEKKFKNIFDNSAEGIFQESLKGKIITANPAFLKMLGYLAIEDIESTKDIYEDEIERQHLLKLLEKQDKVRGHRISLKKKDGSSIIAKINATIVYDDFGTPHYYEGSIQDITNQVVIEKEKERALEDLRIEKNKANNEAAEAKKESHHKSRFLANISHELKTPLNSIMGFFTMLENDLFEGMDDVKQFAIEVKTAGDSLLDIINKNLDLSRIEAGKMDLEESKFELVEEIEKAVRITAANAMQKGLKLDYNIDASVPKTVVGDPIRFRQVLLNLISNAIKFTDKGKIDVSVSLKDMTQTHSVIKTKVIDTGTGIDNDKLSVLFTPYTQLKGGKNVKGGTGLGLVISKELTKLMGGDISVDSELNKGSVFTFTAAFKLFHIDDGTFPMAKIDKPKSKPKSKPVKETETVKVTEADNLPLTKKKLLLVEDNPISQNVEMKILREVGYEVKAVSSGMEAIDSLLLEPFDLVLMDVEMTDMDGITATQKIRKLESEASKIPIIAVTAHSSMKDRERCIAGGMDDYIAKPINIHFMKMTIDQWIGDRA